MSVFTTRFLQWAMVISYCIAGAMLSMFAACFERWAGFAVGSMFALGALFAATLLFTRIVHEIE